MPALCRHRVSLCSSIAHLAAGNPERHRATGGPPRGLAGFRPLRRSAQNRAARHAFHAARNTRDNQTARWLKDPAASDRREPRAKMDRTRKVFQRGRRPGRPPGPPARPLTREIVKRRERPEEQTHRFGLPLAGGAARSAATSALSVTSSASSAVIRSIARSRHSATYCTGDS